MKRWINVVALGLAMVFSAVAQAQEVNHKVEIKRDTRLGTEVLPKGEYDVKFVEGKEGEVVFFRGKREVLKATYTVVKLDKDAENSAVVSTANNDGSFNLKRIEFRGKIAALVFDNTVATAISKH